MEGGLILYGEACVLGVKVTIWNSIIITSEGQNVSFYPVMMEFSCTD